MKKNKTELYLKLAHELAGMSDSKISDADAMDAVMRMLIFFQMLITIDRGLSANQNTGKII